MIYNTTLPEGKSQGRLGHAARRELDALLSDIYASATREWLARQLPELPESRGLHLTGGNGEDSLVLAELPAVPAPLLSIDREAATPGFRMQEQIPFTQADSLNWEIAQDFDFVYMRIWAGAWSGKNALMQSMQRRLKTGGILLVEVVSLSGYQSYPYNHAFARAMELIALLETPQSGTTQQEQIRVLLRQAGFELSEWSAGLPAFISRTGNRVVSLALEACKEAILQCRGSTTDELNALLLELREFEMQDDTLISRPGLLQITAFSSPPLLHPKH